MYKKLLFLLLILCQPLAYAQVSGNIFNSVDKRPVAYANIWKDKALYKATDSIGRFSIEANDLASDFKVSAIGFKEMAFKMENNEREFYLEPDVVQVNEVKAVKRKHQTEQKKGKLKSGGNGYTVQYDAKNGKVARFFPNNGQKNTFLKSIKFKTFSSEGTRMMNLQFYSVDENGAPKELLYHKNVICKIEKKNNKNTINVDHLNIEFPENGIFVVLEHLLLEQNKQFYKFPGALPTSFIYEPYVSTNLIDENFDTWVFKEDEWQQSKKFSVNMEIVVSD